MIKTFKKEEAPIKEAPKEIKVEGPKCQHKLLLTGCKNAVCPVCGDIYTKDEKGEIKKYV